MDQRTLLQELREGSTPLSPIRSTRPELAPGWGQSVSQIREAFSNSTHSRTETKLNPEAAPFVPSNQSVDAGLTRENEECLALFPGPSMRAQRPIRHQSSEPNPDRQNCCLLVTGLPGTVTVTEFIHEMQIRRLGKIAAVCIIPPTPFIATAAVKVTMWNRAGAERLMNAVRSHNFGFDGHKLKIWWNRLKAPAQEEGIPSRVIEVTGRPQKVAPSELLPCFAQYFHFAMDDIVVKQPTPDEMTVEYKFSSYLGQAHNAFVLLRTAEAWKDVTCFYRKDPCEPYEDGPPLRRSKRGTGPKGAIEQHGSELPPSTSKT